MNVDAVYGDACLPLGNLSCYWLVFIKITIRSVLEDYTYILSLETNNELHSPAV